MSLCGEGTLIATGFEHRSAKILRCRAWTCEQCQPTRRKGLIRDISAGHPERLITFTMRPRPGSTPTDDARHMADAFTRLWRKMRAKWPDSDLQYFRVWEAHESGAPHLHVCQRGRFIPWAWLRDRWLELSGSPGVDIRFIPDPARAAGYVAKYLGKDLHRFGTLKRYVRSKTWFLDPAWVPASDPRFFRGCVIDARAIETVEYDWLNVHPQVWWEGSKLVAGPRAPPAIERMRSWVDAHA